MRRQHTYIKRMHIKGAGESAITLKFNSYKDGTVVMDLISGDFFTELELVENSINYIKKVVVPMVVKVFKFNNIKYEVNDLITLNKHVRAALDKALLLKGDLTYDYNINDCQAMVNIGYYPNQQEILEKDKIVNSGNFNEAVKKFMENDEVVDEKILNYIRS